MKLVVSLVIGIGAASVAGQTTSDSSGGNLTLLLTELPTCSLPCYSMAVANSTCASTDLACICSDSIFGTSDMAACLLNCTANGQLFTVRYVKTACGAKVRNNSSEIRQVYWPLYAVALITFICRVMARSKYFGGEFWWDDWAILASFAVLTAVTIGAELMVAYGIGQDVWMLDSERITIVLLLFYIAEFAYVIESALTKLSIILLYLRIFPGNGFRMQCHVLFTLVVFFALAFIITLFTYCQPFSYAWLRWDKRNTGTCIDVEAQTYACAALNIILDVTIFLLPIPQLIALEAKWKTKIGVILIFLVGLFVTVCSIVRLKFLIGWNKSTNQTYDYSGVAVWSIIELNVGVICACMPGMASLFRRVQLRCIENKRSTGRGYGSQQLNSRNKESGIVKTTSVSVHYGMRSGGSISDAELELMDQRIPASLQPARGAVR